MDHSGGCCHRVHPCWVIGHVKYVEMVTSSLSDGAKKVVVAVHGLAGCVALLPTCHIVVALNGLGVVGAYKLLVIVVSTRFNNNNNNNNTYLLTPCSLVSSWFLFLLCRYSL